MRRGWDSCSIFDLMADPELDFTLYHNAEGEIYSIEFGLSHEGMMPYGLSLSQTRREIETILGKSKEPKGYEQYRDFPKGFYPSKRIMIQYKHYDPDEPYEIIFYKEG